MFGIATFSCTNCIIIHFDCGAWCLWTWFSLPFYQTIPCSLLSHLIRLPFLLSCSRTDILPLLWASFSRIRGHGTLKSTLCCLPVPLLLSTFIRNWLAVPLVYSDDVWFIFYTMPNLPPLSVSRFLIVYIAPAIPLYVKRLFACSISLYACCV